MRTKSLDALTRDFQRLEPGVTVWGKGDAAHQSSTSDHNEDDTPGSRAEQQDADSVPEHRAIDVPVLGPMTMAKLRVYRARLTDRPANRARLRYVILEQTIWSRNNGWAPRPYGGEFHNHLHASQDVADDNNGAPWDIGPESEMEGDMDPEESTRLYGAAWRAETLINDRPAVPDNEETRQHGVAGQPNVLHVRLSRMEAMLAELLARGGGQ